MRYENLPCAGCGNPLVAGEDIVTCPDCGTPQHRECWMHDNCCVLKNQHGADFVWSPPEFVELDSGESTTPLQSHIKRWDKQSDETQSQMLDSVKEQESPHFFCPNCGRKNQRGNMQCESCGYLFFAPSANRPAIPGLPQIWIAGQNDPLYIPPEEDLGGVSAGDLALFIQRYARVYLHRFKKIAVGGKKILFNFSAFIFRGYWFLYRKMYAAAGVFLLLTTTLNFIQTMLIANTEAGRQYMGKMEALLNTASASNASPEDAINVFNTMFSAMSEVWYLTFAFIFAQIVLAIIAGFVADRIYYKKTSQIVNQLRKANPDEADFQFAVLREGGVNFFFTAIAALLMFIISSWR